MRPRPPVMRQKRRYILARIEPAGFHPEQKQVYLSVLEAVTSLYGDKEAGFMQPAVVYCEGGYAIVRCTRGSEGDCATALATVTGIADHPACMRTMATSGTILALKRRTRPVVPDIEPAEIQRGEKYFTVQRYPGQKVDLVEKSIKHQKLLFFTEDDVEET
jgi:ribonuclease P/MRP protein subunit POP5